MNRIKATGVDTPEYAMAKSHHSWLHHTILMQIQAPWFPQRRFESTCAYPTTASEGIARSRSTSPESVSSR